jgi:hypothetical protein
MNKPRPSRRVIQTAVQLLSLLLPLSMSTPSSSQVLSESQLFDEAWRAYTTRDFAAASIYLFAYIQRRPADLANNPSRASEVQNAFDFARNQVAEDIAQGRHDRKRVEELEAHASGGIGSSTRGVTAPPPILAMPRRSGPGLPEPGHVYGIISVYSDRAMDVEGASVENGVAVNQYGWHGGPNQQWRFEPLEGVDQGLFRIVCVSSGKVLDVSGVSIDDGAPIHQWEWANGDNQKWLVVPVGDGSIIIEAKHSGKVLDSPNETPPYNGMRTQQWTRHGGPNQRWRLRAL